VITAFTFCSSILLLLSDQFLFMMEKILSTGADVPGKKKYELYQLLKV